MRIVPAIDIFDGKVVRLRQGDFAKMTTYSDDPISISSALKDQGFGRLHLVDLTGAKRGVFDKANLKLIEKVVTRTSFIVDFSGGIRGASEATQTLAAGAAFVGIGSLAVKDPESTKRIIESIEYRAFIACDVKDGSVKISGWTADSNVNYLAFLKSWNEFGLNHFLVTDISKDGTLNGANIDLYRTIKREIPTAKIIASGGVSSSDDIISLEGTKIEEAVIGRALLEGKLDLESVRRFIW